MTMNTPLGETTTSPWVFDVEADEFAQRVVEASRQAPVLVDFWAPWCGPCRILGPILEALARERQGAFSLAKVDIDRNAELASNHGVTVVPAVRVFKGGKMIDAFDGVLPQPELKRLIDRHAPDPLDVRVIEARAREAEDPVAAEATYREVLAARPRHEAASLGLARVLLAGDRDDEAKAALAPVLPGREDRPEAERLQALLALRALVRGLPPVDAVDLTSAEGRYRTGLAHAVKGEHEPALEALLEAAKADKALGKSKVREAMVHVFTALGARHALSDRYRQALTRAIY